MSSPVSWVAGVAGRSVSPAPVSYRLLPTVPLSLSGQSHFRSALHCALPGPLKLCSSSWFSRGKKEAAPESSLSFWSCSEFLAPLQDCPRAPFLTRPPPALSHLSLCLCCTAVRATSVTVFLREASTSVCWPEPRLQMAQATTR